VPPVEQPPLFSRSDIAAVQNALVQHCETQADRIALLDPPGPDIDLGQIEAWRLRFDSTYAALYHPWMLVFDPLAAARVRAVPPSGHAAGVCARNDLSTGVHNAPANELVDWAVGVTSVIDAELQGILNPLGVNCIRPLPGRGIRVYGARTVSSDPSWRFLNVRRLLLMIEEAVEEAVQWTAFEPNDFALRQSLTVSISTFLAQLWERGAFAGASPADAFFVKCDEDNNPPEEADAGRLIVDVGVAAVRPAEFVVFRIGRTRDELEVIE
jgi:phage tail sheath protein FI